MTKHNNNHNPHKQEQTKLLDIPSPYNFVPLSDKVHFPGNANKVSQDIPRSRDALSGKIECELVTDSPLYVRNGGVFEKESDIPERKACKENPDYISFFNVNGKKIIPGSSLKGMIRNVVEIASFSKLNKVDDRKYGFRDLNNPDASFYRDYFTVTQNGRYVSKVKAGWLTLETGRVNTWMLSPCSYARVEQDDLKHYYKSKKRYELNLNDRRFKSGVDKYDAWRFSLDVSFDELKDYRHQGTPLLYTKAEKIRSGSRGTMVFTGQAGKKHMEFIFYNQASNPIDVTSLMEDFEFIHSENGKNNKEWDFWNNKAKQKHKVPVFYLERDGEVHSMGLAQMYRLAYDSKIMDAIGGEHEKPERDFAEILFGHVSKDDAIRGRISVSHATLTKDCGDEETQDTVLGGPKPTFYPTYLKQSGEKLKTFMDSDAKVRGWKRYPARSIEAEIIPAKEDQKKVSTSFTPLKQGAAFTFTLTFHNLLAEELGAIVWALTWDGDTTLRHGLGMAKPCGLGQVRLKIIGGELLSIEGENPPFDLKQVPFQGSDTLQQYSKEFVSYMKKRVFNEWAEETGPIRELLAMANPVSIPKEKQKEKFQHMELPEFAKAKKAKARLYPHTERKTKETFAFVDGNSTIDFPKKKEFKSVSPIKLAFGKTQQDSAARPKKVGDKTKATVTRIEGNRVTVKPEGQECEVTSEKRYGVIPTIKSEVRVKIEKMDSSGTITKIKLI